MSESTRKNFNELNSAELSLLLKEYHSHKVETRYGWKVPFSIKDFYTKKYKGFYHFNIGQGLIQC